MRYIKKTILTILILLVMSILIIFFVITPSIYDINAFNDRIQIERISIENKYTNRRNIKNVIADLKYVNDGINDIKDTFIINKDQIVNFISKLENIANNNNVIQDIKITPQNIGKEKLAQKYPLHIILSGDYINILKYLNDIERSDIYLTIESIDINSPKNKNSIEVLSGGDVKTNLEGYVYFSI